MTTEDAAAEAATSDPLRGPKRLLSWGSAVALLFAIASSAAGGGGALGLFLLLLVLALVFGLTGLWIGARALKVQFDGGAAPTSHWVFAAGMFVAALACMVASGGVVTTLGSAT